MRSQENKTGFNLSAGTTRTVRRNDHVQMTRQPDQPPHRSPAAAIGRATHWRNADHFHRIGEVRTVLVPAHQSSHLLKSSGKD
jgi:hypothetical protein